MCLYSCNICPACRLAYNNFFEPCSKGREGMMCTNSSTELRAFRIKMCIDNDTHKPHVDVSTIVPTTAEVKKCGKCIVAMVGNNSTNE